MLGKKIAKETSNVVKSRKKHTKEVFGPVKFWGQLLLRLRKWDRKLAKMGLINES